MIKYKRRKAIKGEVLSFVRTFTRVARGSKRPSEEKMIKGIMRQIERKGSLKKAFKLTWGRPPSPVEIHSLRTKAVIIPKRMRALGRYSPEEEKILLRSIDPRTVMHEWTHLVELSHINNRKRVEYLYEPKLEQRAESELYGLLSEVGVSITIGQKTGKIISPIEKISENVLKYKKRKFTPREKQDLKKQILRSWMRYFEKFSTPEMIKKIATSKRISKEELDAYAKAHRIGYKVLKDILKKS